MPVYFQNSTRGVPIGAAALVRALEKLLATLGEGDSSVSLSLVRDRRMRELNASYRGKDTPTDVLSFSLVEGEAGPAAGERMLGDIVISIDTALRQAKEYDAPLERELRRLIIHGLLHLLGHDHEEPDDAKRMRTEERRLAKAIQLPWPY